MMATLRSVLFSEGSPLYLWQIRHIPISRQTFFRLTTRLGLLLLLAGSSGWVVRLAVGQSEGPTASDKSGRTATEVSGQNAATAFVARVHAELKRHPSVKADIEHSVSIGNQQFRATGRYLHQGSKLRVEYLVKPDQGADGSLVEVCDGKELWTLMILGGTKRVTHRDVQQIQAAAALKNLPEADVSAEMGMGGLPALFASLERTMTFEAMKQVEDEGRPRTIVQGQWKRNIVSRWKRKPDDPLPAFVPDLVRIVVDSGTLFPERIIYLKRQTERDKKGYRTLVSFRFQNVELDAAIDDQEFTFVPPEDVDPEDVTRQFLDRITKGQENESSPATPGSPPTKAKSAAGSAR